ncbi:hypothetical protein [Crassaminicella profunda]|uniref:hypothetical protein n=1 Tax=Crassaminicella profunda TaxID=1286698 RepID=UPI001CA62A9D|nr:hypothetical protein [Crassaminicella profunda]QZY56735.1 hypothetical protein K7H06_07380 [Crassaminicella profunda]
MKVVAKPIEMIAWFEQNGAPHPIRFRLKNNDECWNIIKVERVITVEKEKLAGNYMYVFTCQSVINDVTKVYVLKYELSSCKWVLFKI